ncbi:hypothetical protein OUZ56_005633 [Daphnia magna]|uniref:Uncharacterized protein n=1 Tax=Daphnia magna TaxID=35525 RepID=A0ABQ9YTB1_9CRUS|nr:hypothetical protein OUZ56_005633 [Daphnia magna]
MADIVTWSMTTLCDPVSIQYYRTCDVSVSTPYIVPRSRVSGSSLSLVNRQYNILLHGGDAEPPAVAVRDP